ncbi:MAG: SRPBCC family protein [Nitrospirota bacterium]
MKKRRFLTNYYFRKLIFFCSNDAWRLFCFEITPDWLDFRMVNQGKTEVFNGVEFDYTIRWLGLKLRWQSRIIDYKPPERFTDIQIIGPFQYWRHLHVFERVSEGILLKDEVTYKVPFGLVGILLHALVIKRQLKDIFSYRAIRISEWARGGFKSKVK